MNPLYKYVYGYIYKGTIMEDHLNLLKIKHNKLVDKWVLAYENPWTFQGKPVTLSDVGDYVGFVYLITNLETGKKYVGKKFFYSETKISIPNKKRKVTFTKMANWFSYWSSNSTIKDELKKGIKFKREILSFHKSKPDTNYGETLQLFSRGVLTTKNGEYEYYNDNIDGRYYKHNYTSYEMDTKNG